MAERLRRFLSASFSSSSSSSFLLPFSPALLSRTKTIAQPTEVKMEAVMRTNLRRGRGSAVAEATAVPEAGSGVGCEEGTPRDRNGWRMDTGG